MSRKCEVISSTVQLSSLIDPFKKDDQSQGVYLRCPHYLALGCDLANIDDLRGKLAGEIDHASCMVLCVAEVSITYMNTVAADALIKWASHMNDGTWFRKHYAVGCSEAR